MARLGRAQPFPPVVRHEQSLAAPVSQQKSVSDTVSLTEGFTLRVQKLYAETVGLTETFTKQVQKALSETVTLTEPGFTAIKKILAALPETVLLTETQVLKTGKVFAETVALSEALALKTSKAFAETVVLSDGFAVTKKFIAALGDATALTESNFLKVGKLAAETVLLAESNVLRTGKALAEGVGLSEGFSATRKFVADVGDNLGLTEALTKLIQKLRGETVGLAEQLDVQSTGGGAPYRGAITLTHLTRMIDIRA